MSYYKIFLILQIISAIPLAFSMKTEIDVLYFIPKLKDAHFYHKQNILDEITQRIEAKKDLDAPLKSSVTGCTALEEIFRCKIYDYLEPLLQAGATPTGKALLTATRLANSLGDKGLECLALLLKYKANPNVGTVTDLPLVEAIISTMDQSKRKATVSLLLFYGANPYKKDGDYRSALDYAKASQSQELINLLEQSQVKLRERLTRILSREQMPFNNDIAQLIAQHVYKYT